MEEELRRETTRDLGRAEGRAQEHDPFNHPRDRRGYFRSTSKKLSRLEPNNLVNIFSFMSRDSMPGVESGYVEKKDDDTYLIAINRGGRVAKIVHEGPLNKSDLHQLLLDYGYGKPNAKTTLAVDSRNKIDAVVSEYARGFSAESGLPVAGSPAGRHYVMAFWNRMTFYDNEDLTPDQLKFLTDNQAVIAFKSQVGADPELDYFKTADLAREKFDVYARKLGRI